MSTVISKTSWKDVAPIVCFWIVSDQIAKLKNFIRLFTKLNYVHRLEAIREIMQAEVEDFPINTLKVIRDIHDCIRCSPQLLFEQAKITNISYSTRIFKQYTAISLAIADFFNRFDNQVTLSYVKIMVSRLLQASEPVLIKELFKFYVDIWQYYVKQSGNLGATWMFLVMPSSVSFEERNILQTALDTDSDHRYSEILSLHYTLVSTIKDVRNYTSIVLIKNVENKISNLQQVLKDRML